MIKQLELCYIHSKVLDKDALQRLIDAARANADRRLFSSIQTGMEQRKQQIIVIINGTRIPTTFSLVVTVEDTDTGRAIPGATVIWEGFDSLRPAGWLLLRSIRIRWGIRSM